jgi:aspartate/methionine/tyrosine aminotransferase
MLNARLETLRDYPFQRLAALIADLTPRANVEPIALSVGEPQHKPPAFIRDIIARHEDWNRYPPIPGTPEFRRACADWLTRRYRLPAGMIEADTMIAPCAGTREGLYMAATLAVTPAESGPRPLAFIPNPLYQVYLGAAVLAGAEPVLMPTTRATGFLPDLDALDPVLLARTQIMYLCSPSNPQGAVADLDYLKRAILLARRHGFLLVLDECYAEIYSTDDPPPGGLQAAHALGGSLDNIIVFHTLSKRSSVPGLRSGFAAGPPATIALLNRLRSYACAATPLATLDAATALWRDEAHVLENRTLYRRKFDMAESLLGGRFGFYRPGGGFYLWLEVGDGEEATRKLWRDAAVKVLPGAYLTRPDVDGSNPNQAYIRIALVSDLETTEAALTRIARTL